MGTPLPLQGAVLITVNDFDKSTALKIARDLHRMGFELYVTTGTAAALQRVNLPVTMVKKAAERGLNTVQLIASGMVQLVINTPLGQQAHQDPAAMQSTAIQHNVFLITTISAAQAAVSGIKALQKKDLRVRSLQQHHAGGVASTPHS